MTAVCRILLSSWVLCKVTQVNAFSLSIAHEAGTIMTPLGR